MAICPELELAQAPTMDVAPCEKPVVEEEKPMTTTAPTSHPPADLLDQAWESLRGFKSVLPARPAPKSMPTGISFPSVKPRREIMMGSTRSLVSQWEARINNKTQEKRNFEIQRSSRRCVWVRNELGQYVRQAVDTTTTAPSSCEEKKMEVPVVTKSTPFTSMVDERPIGFSNSFAFFRRAQPVRVL